MRNGIVAGLFVVSVIAVAFVAKGESDAYSDAVAMVRGLGYLTFVALSAALCISPLRAWIQESAKLRRALGLSAASGAALHAFAAILNSPLSLRDQFADTHLRFGMGAFAVLFVLALTSFPSVVRWMRLRSWKELHRLAYVAWLCALLHALLSPYAWLVCLLVLASLVLLIGLLRVRRFNA
ncbi:MAG TPA: ferric reductase-like transmembrane domain-containing protein [Polyangiales bacterium]|nr:ferric reductase-like transmembrane domain-containing protein [Polyangiales bacterium]